MLVQPQAACRISKSASFAGNPSIALDPARRAGHRHGKVDLVPGCFGTLIARLKAGGDIMSPLARAIGSKGYHDRSFDDGPYPVEPHPA